MVDSAHRRARSRGRARIRQKRSKNQVVCARCHFVGLVSGMACTTWSSAASGAASNMLVSRTRRYAELNESALCAATDGSKRKTMRRRCKMRAANGLSLTRGRPGRSNTRPLKAPSGHSASQFTHGQVAQLVEQRTENPRVDGSIPSLATISQTVTYERASAPSWRRCGSLGAQLVPTPVPSAARARAFIPERHPVLSTRVVGRACATRDLLKRCCPSLLE